MSSNEFPSWMVLESNDDWDSVDEIPGYSFYNGEYKLFFDPGPHVYYRFAEEGERVNVDGVTTVLDVINKPFLKQWAAKVAVEYIQSQMLLPDGSFKQFSTEEFLAMLQVAKAQHKVRLDIAGDIGHLAHEILEHSIQYAIDHTQGIVHELKSLPQEENSITIQAVNCANAAHDWMKRHNCRWVATERKIYSRTYDFAGTEDGICVVDSCTDLKCCKGRVFTDRKAIADFKSSNQLSESYAMQVAAYQFAEIEEFGQTITDRWVLRLGKEKFEFEPWYLPADEFESDLEAFLAALTLYRSLKEITERRKRGKAEIREIVKKQRDEAKAIQEAEERAQRAVAKAARMQATRERSAAKKQHYEELRGQGLSPADARLIAYPKKDKPEPESETEEGVVEPNPEPKPEPKIEEPSPYVWELKL